MEDKVWNGLVSVSGPKQNAFLDGAVGAYINALAWAVDEEDFRKQISVALREQLEVFMESAEDIEPFDAKLLKHEASEKLKQLANKVAITHEVAFGSFFFWDEREKLSGD